MKNITIRCAGGELALSKIIMGTCPFGTGIPEDKSVALLNEYAGLGGATLDTAAVYGDWEDKRTPISEEVIGRWLRKTRRKDITLITKGAHYRLATPEASRVSADCIREDLEQSLRALGVDCIDVYFLHRDNPAKPVEEIMPALDEAVRAGKIRAIGASNWTAARIREANRFARENGMAEFTVSEIRWSLAHVTLAYNEFPSLPLMDEHEYAAYQELGIPVLAWNSQASGVITKVLNQGVDALSELVRNKYYNDTTRRRIENVQAVCAQEHITPTQAALGYITCNPLPGAAIVGCSSTAQVRDSMSAADLELPPEAVARLTR